MPNIDVIIPLYNGENWIEESIQSALSQTHKPHQIIVVDDGSTDNSAEIVSKISGIIYIRKSRKNSASLTRNEGLAKSTAEYVAFLDQDDVWHPKHLEILLEELEKNPKLPAVVAMSTKFKDGEIPSFDISNKKVELTDPWTTFPFTSQYEPSLFLYRRWIFESNGWPEHCEGKSDYVLWFQMSVKYQIPRVMIESVAKRIHSQGYFQQVLKNMRLFLSNWVKVADELKVYYLKHQPVTEKKQWLMKRVSIVHIFAQLFESVEQRDRILVAKQANKLEALLTDEDMNFQKTAVKYFFNLISKLFTVKQSTERNECYEFLLESWPCSAVATRKILTTMIIQKKMGLKFYRNHYLKNPFQMARVIIILRIIKRKLHGGMI